MTDAARPSWATLARSGAWWWRALRGVALFALATCTAIASGIGGARLYATTIAAAAVTAHAEAPRAPSDHPESGSHPAFEKALSDVERRMAGAEQWTRDSASVQIVGLTAQVRFEAALYERDPALRAAAGLSAALAFKAEARGILSGYWALPLGERGPYKLDDQLSDAQARALGTTHAPPARRR